MKIENTNFTRTIQQPNDEERAKLLYRLYSMDRTQTYLSKIFRKSQQQINQAFSGSQPTLMNKIKKHIEILEQNLIEKN